MENHKSNTQTQSNPSFVNAQGGGEVAAPSAFKGRLLLGKHDNARKSLARLTREYAAGNLDAVMYRNLVYGLSVMLNYFKHEADQEILSRLEALEQKMEARK